MFVNPLIKARIAEKTHLKDGEDLKQINVIFSYIFIIVGACIITSSKIAEQLVPRNGFYDVDLSLNYWIGALIAVLGMAGLIINSKFYENYVKEVDLRKREFEEKNKLDNTQ